MVDIRQVSEEKALLAGRWAIYHQGFYHSVRSLASLGHA